MNNLMYILTYHNCAEGMEHRYMYTHYRMHNAKIVCARECFIHDSGSNI